MKLISAQIAKFKNILDSTPVEIESDVTCLVGKNESGKTAYLHALYRLRPVRPNAVFNVRLQYPAWLEKRHRMEKTAAPVVVAEFELEPDDMAKVLLYVEAILFSSVIPKSRSINPRLEQWSANVQLPS
jgi:predicted ATP-dependent endonuclease of OLD family